MRLVTYTKGGAELVGVKLPGGVAPVGYDSLLELIRDGEKGVDSARAAAAEAERGGNLDQPDRILAPVHPERLMFHGINFASIVEETDGAKLPTRPLFFSKLPSAVIGPDEPIVKPFPETGLDWEAELAWVIGKPGRRIAVEDALDHVFGYTVVNDVSARDIQMDGGDIMLGKSCDTFCPMGPELVLTDEIQDPSALVLSAFVNGERVQHAPLEDMLFSVPQIVSHLSQHVVLEAGDLITSGTPAGLGLNMKPPRWLQPGDEVTVEVDQIGQVSNTVVAGW